MNQYFFVDPCSSASPTFLVVPFNLEFVLSMVVASVSMISEWKKMKISSYFAIKTEISCRKYKKPFDRARKRKIRSLIE